MHVSLMRVGILKQTKSPNSVALVHASCVNERFRESDTKSYIGLYNLFHHAQQICGLYVQMCEISICCTDCLLTQCDGDSHCGCRIFHSKLECKQNIRKCCHTILLLLMNIGDAQFGHLTCRKLSGNPKRSLLKNLADPQQQQQEEEEQHQQHQAETHL